MSTRYRSALFTLIAITLPCMAVAQQFEGVIKQRMMSVERYALEEKGFEMSEAVFDVPTERILALREELEADGMMTVEEAEMYVKGNMIRTDMRTEEGPAYATMDLEHGIIRLFQPSERMYIEWTREDMERMRAMMPTMGGAADQPEPRATGLTRSINGMSCTAYDVDTENGVTRVWVSNDNSQLVEAFSGLMESIDAMTMEEGETDESALVIEHGFPVLMLRLSYDTYEIEETLSVDRQSVSDDLFAPPAGYTKMTMADMMRGGD